jgi:hypothetical protein
MLKSVISIVLVVSIVGLFGGCEEFKQNRKIRWTINNFLNENGWETITSGSKEKASEQLFAVLGNYQFGRGDGTLEEMIQRQARCADLIIETGCFGTAESALSNYDFYCMELGLWIALKVDALPEKTEEAEKILELFYENIQFEPEYNWVAKSFTFLKFYEEAPDIFEKFYPEVLEENKIKKAGSLANAVINASKEMKNAIIRQITADDESTLITAFPLSAVEAVLADFKPLFPQKGGYFLVFDDRTRKVGEFTLKAPANMADEYKTDTLFPVINPNNAQIIIYETYSYEMPDGYWFGTVFLRHTNVLVVNAATGRTVFNKTFRSSGDERYFYSGDYVLDDDYNENSYAEQISALIQRE